MVSSKNRNYHRNYGCNLVEITFKAIGIGARHTPPKAHEVHARRI
jgi:hypothetical protein